jgi:hypothetical protein
MTLLSLKNRAASTLASGISDEDLSLTVASGEGSNFPDSNFLVTIDDEILLCSSRSSDVLTVTRGQEDTTPAVHSQGADVSLKITAGTIGEIQTQLATLYDCDHTEYTVGSTRKSGTTYTNGTKIRIVQIQGTLNYDDDGILVYIGPSSASILIARLGILSAVAEYYRDSMSFCVPPGWKYSVTEFNSAAIDEWHEWDLH